MVPFHQRPKLVHHCEDSISKTQNLNWCHTLIDYCNESQSSSYSTVDSPLQNHQDSMSEAVMGEARTLPHLPIHKSTSCQQILMEEVADLSGTEVYPEFMTTIDSRSPASTCFVSTPSLRHCIKDAINGSFFSEPSRSIKTLRCRHGENWKDSCPLGNTLTKNTLMETTVILEHKDEKKRMATFLSHVSYTSSLYFLRFQLQGSCLIKYMILFSDPFR